MKCCQRRCRGVARVGARWRWSASRRSIRKTLCGRRWCDDLKSKWVAANAAQARAQGRHQLQTSDALGAAKVQVGPEALAYGAHLNKQMGLSLGHTGRVLPMG